MERKLVTVIPQLLEEQRQRITDQADQYGIQALFFNSPQEAEKEVQNAEILFGQLPDLVLKAESLRWCSTPSAGAEAFLKDGVLPEGVLLTNASGAYGVTISEHIVMMILMILRQEAAYMNHVRDRKWVRNLPMRSIHGSRITLIGTGDIGTETAKRLRAFEPACLIGVNRSGKPNAAMDEVRTADSLDETLRRSDIVIVSLPKAGHTDNLLDAKRLALLPDGALVINVGRGNCIDENALIKETESGRLYAGLDVFQKEPLPQESPLWNINHVLVTTHIAGDMSLPYTVEKIVQMFLANLCHYANSEPMEHVVDRKLGY